ncbi:DNA mismatch repair endonuclease MutL [Legionella nagasakiensis]|uniref:DNA mismatch repair endonuclease MutL n=1 Tax=Legionella nagasakiensis TaxID=535290 RepID=UPI001056C706|nr:DNA mismatch repair endonuclease MutL [Legionella nagasakiensis]
MVIRIHQLPPEVANQIAAGEVIERPASVVKELLENSVDAGASAIHIEIDSGGLSRIKVSDNGSGIFADDLLLAVTAHATSKIANIDDLYAISSMGFRGEALASIASVSKLLISSKPAVQEHAVCLSMRGTDHRLLPCARQQGTTVEVHDLFFNAPVRKKFLKSSYIEYQAIDAVVRRFAMSIPTISITLSHNGKPMLVLPSAVCEKNKQLRIKKLLGKAFVEQAIALDVMHGEMQLYGWIAGPSYQRSQNDRQWVYVNQRMVKDKLINHAIKQAYDGLLHPGRYPACLLYLSIAPQEVDVNVHPTKHEVRFQQPRLVHDLIVSQLSCGLSRPRTESVNPFMPKVNDRSSIQIRETGAPRFSFVESISRDIDLPALVVLNPCFALFFVTEEAFLVDVKRLYRHRLASLLKQQSLPLASRPLLVPVRYSIDACYYRTIEQNQPNWKQLGIQLDFIGETTIIIRSVPKIMPQLDLQKLLERLILDKCFGLSEQLNALLDCQSFDIKQLEYEEQQDLANYFVQLISQFGPSESWYIPLSLDICRGLLND